MRTLIVYESVYGNTHATAERIADGLRRTGEVVVVSVAAVTAEQIAAADLLVVGGPTHMHGMSSSRTRQMAVKAAADADSDVVVDPDAEGPGIRSWLDELGDADGRRAVAFDTRLEGPPLLTGRASRGIARRLHHHGFDVVADPESFLVDKKNHLVPGEADRASRWGASLASSVNEWDDYLRRPVTEDEIRREIDRGRRHHA